MRKSKRINRTHRTSKTRKIIRKNILLKHLPKMRGAGRGIMTSFKVVCNPEEAHARLTGIKSLKSPEDSDDFVHVILSMVGKKEVVVKVQEPGIMLNRELDIQKRLKDQNNIVKFICDFPCLFDIAWMKPLSKPRTFCDPEGTPQHMIVMEFINNDLANYLSGNYTDSALISIIKQLGFSLLEIHINHGIKHGDINRGNILLNMGQPMDIVYNVENLTETVNTLGNEVVLIDFQRGMILPKNNSDYIFQVAVDEISLTYHYVSTWVKNPVHKHLLVSLTNSTISASDIKELFGIISNAGTSAREIPV